MDVLAQALVHFLWQGALIAAAAWVGFRLARGSASMQYAIGLVALLLMCAAPVVTTWRLHETKQSVAADVARPATSSVTALPAVDATPTAQRDADIPRGARAGMFVSLPTDLVLLLWLVGVSVTTTRMAGAWWLARRLASRGVRPGAAALVAVVERLRAKAGLSRRVDVRESALALTPMLFGWLRPVIVLPTAVVTELTPAQLDAIIAHELAHVRRHDYLVNVGQMVIESLLFYHPAVWWVSRRVREARELCCDDLVVQTTDRLTYAEALSRIAASGLRMPAVAASGGKLRDRVVRVLAPPPTQSSGVAGLLPIVLLIVGVMPIYGTDQRPTPPVPADTASKQVAPMVEVPREVEPEPATPPAARFSMVNVMADRIDITSTGAPASTVTLSGNVTLEVLPESPVGTPNWSAAATGPTVPALGEQQAPAPSPPVHILVVGLVLRPGVHQFDGTMPTLGRALERAGGTTVDASLVEFTIRRRIEQVTETQMVIAGTHLDIGNELPLKSGDVVVVRTVTDPVPRKVFAPVYINGEVNAPGAIEWREGFTVSKAIAWAFGLKPAASMGRSIIRRRFTRPDGKQGYRDIGSLKDTTPLEPGDELVIRRKWIG
jgi:beta-lactamase regulating signal transducer with metallopeptidase domain/protein involved in polysaccharide export with SLBB domain